MAILINPLTSLGDKAASLGALVFAMGCAMCFPAIVSRCENGACAIPAREAGHE